MRAYKDIIIFNKLVYCFTKLKQHNWKLDYDNNITEDYMDLTFNNGDRILFYYNLKTEIIVFETDASKLPSFKHLLKAYKLNAKKI